ncbi:class I adenylate-forming enzyme family protein [Gordonia sp. 'Campus']|uniref:class I adenylate-forming enzyme family protein n=1 Tax=Gordonia sp. 'Campus' TaxID=2915824 RepID=UPI001EE43CFE|nr:class I adenylate-forming enzyme family protein [Gordonia sp. 'Campus']
MTTEDTHSTTDADDTVSYVQAIRRRLLTDGTGVVLVDEDRGYTGHELLGLVARLAGAMTTHDIGRGHRVALVAPATGEAVAARYAASSLGAATVFCPDAGSPERLRVFLSRTSADFVIVFPSTAHAVSDVVDARVLSVGPVDGLPNLMLDAAAGGIDRALHVEISPDDECVLVATGGTTGVSKASVRTQREYRRLVDLGPTPGRRQLICTPLAYIAQTLMDTVLLGGGCVHLHDGFVPTQVLATIAQARITHLALVEPLLVDLIDSDALPGTDLSSVIAISHVGADAAASLRRRLVLRMGRSALANPYGASEFGVVSVLAGPEYSAGSPHLGTSGRPLPMVDLEIRGDDGALCLSGEQGVIHVRTPAQAHRYSVAPPRPGFTDDGWFDTGDVGVLDVDGYLTVRGRSGDMRRTDAGDTFPVDLQDTLCAHAQVRYAVAVPAPDRAPGAFGVVVTLCPGATVTTDDLKAHLDQARPGLGDVTIVIVDAVPVTEQGKPHRADITSLLFS